MDQKYNGWANKETWLVNLWYGEVADYYLEQYQSTGELPDADDVAEFIRFAAEEGETLSQPPTNGLLGDFLETCWSEVNWHEIAEIFTEFVLEEVEENSND